MYSCGCDFMEHGQGRDAAQSLEEYVDSMYRSIDKQTNKLTNKQRHKPMYNRPARVVKQPLEVLVRAEDKLRTCYSDLGTVLFQVTLERFTLRLRFNVACLIDLPRTLPSRSIQKRRGEMAKFIRNISIVLVEISTLN